MSSDYRPRSGGGRRPRHRRNGPREEFRRSAPAKQGFFGSIISWIKGLFGGESKSYSSSSPRPSRTPGASNGSAPAIVPTEVTSPRLYVGNLSYDAVESDLFDLFSKEGSVKNVEIVMDRRANRCKGFGFVEMESLETAKAAAQKLSHTEFMGRQILVMGAKSERREQVS